MMTSFDSSALVRINSLMTRYDDDHDDFGGLHRDLRSTGARMDRRRLLRTAARLGASFGTLQLLGCSGADTTDATDPLSGDCSKVPSETEGPFPGDGSNGPSVLNQTGVVRSDVRT